MKIMFNLKEITIAACPLDGLSLMSLDDGGALGLLIVQIRPNISQVTTDCSNGNCKISDGSNDKNLYVSDSNGNISDGSNVMY